MLACADASCPVSSSSADTISAVGKLISSRSIKHRLAIRLNVLIAFALLFIKIAPAVLDCRGKYIKNPGDCSLTGIFYPKYLILLGWFRGRK